MKPAIKTCLLVGVSLAAAFSDVCRGQGSSDAKTRAEMRRAAHSRVHSSYLGPMDLVGIARLGAVATGEKVAHGQRDEWISISVGHSDEPLTSRPGDERPFLVKASERADLIVLGVMTARESMLTEERNFVFTDYQMRVEEVFKSNPISLVAPGERITVTQPGGLVELEGRRVLIVEEDFRAFQLGGRYILYLSFIEETGAYRPDSRFSYQLAPGRVSSLGRSGGVGEAMRQVLGQTGYGPTPEDFLQAVRIAAEESQ